EKEWKAKKVKEFMTQLNENPALKTLAELPITLTLLSQIWTGEVMSLTTLYEHMVSAFVAHYCLKHALGPIQTAALTSEHPLHPSFLMSLLSYVAFQGMIQGQTYFSDDDLLDAIFAVKDGIQRDRLSEAEQTLYNLSPAELLQHLTCQ